MKKSIDAYENHIIIRGHTLMLLGEEVEWVESGWRETSISSSSFFHYLTARKHSRHQAGTRNNASDAPIGIFFKSNKWMHDQFFSPVNPTLSFSEKGQRRKGNQFLIQLASGSQCTSPLLIIQLSFSFPFLLRRLRKETEIIIMTITCTYTHNHYFS